MGLIRSGLVLGGVYLMSKNLREDRGQRVAPQEFVRGAPREDYPANQQYGYQSHANGQGYDQSRQQYPRSSSQDQYPPQDYGKNPQQQAYNPAPYQPQQNSASGYPQQKMIERSGQGYGPPGIPTYEEATSIPSSLACNGRLSRREHGTEKSSNML